ncbi:hypothetical protein R1flu_008047 [Riccia fluitans]|uniref:Uncharacterized protein n=1 Tax=Riccia fluitans TaxID=41844 RepID=A0ABD1YAL6_9MARC
MRLLHQEIGVLPSLKRCYIGHECEEDVVVFRQPIGSVGQGIEYWSGHHQPASCSNPLATSRALKCWCRDASSNICGSVTPVYRI